MMKSGGRCGVVIKNTFLSGVDNSSVIALRKQLLEECNLYGVLDLPQGVFIGTGVKTVVLFFEKGISTEKIWYYQLNLGRSTGKTNPLNEIDLEDFVKKAKNQEESNNSWFVDVNSINNDNFDLSVKNPNITELIDNRSPQEIINEIEKLDIESAQSLIEIKGIL